LYNLVPFEIKWVVGHVRITVQKQQGTQDSACHTD
jgi:hypothetical protein